MRKMTNLLCFSPVAALMFTPLFAPALGARSEPPIFTNPADIDRAVQQFTGANIGQVGGARTPTDRRLRLAYCDGPLMTSWHGRAGQTVRVECPEVNGWRIFVSTRPQPAAQTAQRIVRRGDPITVAVRGRGFSVQQSGEALDSGAIGDWIAVRTARKREPIQARIERPGFAIIPAS